jgi:hypothetical protein
MLSRLNATLKHYVASGISLLTVAMLGQLPATAAQFSLDWGMIAETGQWPDGTQQGSFNIGGGTVDVSFGVGDGIEFVSFEDSGLTPAINTVLNGANPDDDPALHLQIDSEQVGEGNPLYSVVMNTNFTGYTNPIEDMSFWLHDVDISGAAFWQDRVSIQGFLGDQLINPTFEFLPNTVELVNAFTLDGIGVADNDSSQGDVRVVFDGPIDRWTLTYSDGDDVDIFDPDSHGIGIGDISWTETKDVPEASAGVAVLTTGGLLLTLKNLKHRLARNKLA